MRFSTKLVHTGLVPLRDSKSSFGMSYGIQPQMVYFRGTFEGIELLKDMTNKQYSPFGAKIC